MKKIPADTAATEIDTAATEMVQTSAQTGHDCHRLPIVPIVPQLAPMCCQALLDT